MTTVLTVAECAKQCRISTATVYRLIHRNELPAVRLGGQFRISSQALEELLVIDHRSEARESNLRGA